MPQPHVDEDDDDDDDAWKHWKVTRAVGWAVTVAERRERMDAAAAATAVATSRSISMRPQLLPHHAQAQCRPLPLPLHRRCATHSTGQHHGGQV